MMCKSRSSGRRTRRDGPDDQLFASVSRGMRASGSFAVRIRRSRSTLEIRARCRARRLRATHSTRPSPRPFPSSFRPSWERVNDLKAVLLLTLLMAVAVAPAAAQMQGPPGTAPTPPPLVIPQTTTPPPGGGVFLGGVPTGTATGTAIPLTAVDAVVRALEHNLGVLQAEEAAGRAQGARWRMLSELLPNVSGRVTETRQKINLTRSGSARRAGRRFRGCRISSAPSTSSTRGCSCRNRCSISGAINDARSRRTSLEAARLTTRSARDFVIHVAGDALSSQALASAARADATRGRSSKPRRRCTTRRSTSSESGIVAGIDVLRAEVAAEHRAPARHGAARTSSRRPSCSWRAIDRACRSASTSPSIRALPDCRSPDDDARAGGGARVSRRGPTIRRRSSGCAQPKRPRAAVIGEALPSLHFNADYGDDRARARRRRGDLHRVRRRQRPDLPGRANARPPARSRRRPPQPPRRSRGSASAHLLRRSDGVSRSAVDRASSCEVATRGARARRPAAHAGARPVRRRRRPATSRSCRRSRRSPSPTNSSSPRNTATTSRRARWSAAWASAEESLRQYLGGSR